MSVGQQRPRDAEGGYQSHGRGAFDALAALQCLEAVPAPAFAHQGSGGIGEREQGDGDHEQEHVAAREGEDRGHAEREIDFTQRAALHAVQHAAEPRPHRGHEPKQSEGADGETGQQPDRPGRLKQPREREANHAHADVHELARELRRERTAGLQALDPADERAEGGEHKRDRNGG